MTYAEVCTFSIVSMSHISVPSKLCQCHIFSHHVLQSRQIIAICADVTLLPCPAFNAIKSVQKDFFYFDVIFIVTNLFQTKMHSYHIYMWLCTNDMDVPFTALSPIPLQQDIYRNATNSQAYMVMFDRYDRLIFWLKNCWLYMCMVCGLSLDI